MTTAQNQRLVGLDGLRALAVSFVIFSHFSGPTIFPEGTPAKTFASSLGVGGVDLFFVISGLLITHLLLNEERQLGRISLSLFYARRAIRILPPAYAYLAFVFIAVMLGYARVEPADFLLSIFFLRNWSGWSSAETGHIWSLSIEEQFYLFWPMILLRLRSHRGRILISVCTLCLAPLYRALWYKLFGLFAAEGPLQIWRTDFHCEGIVAGCLLALLMDSKSRVLKGWGANTPIGFLVAITMAFSFWAQINPLQHMRYVRLSTSTLTNIGLAICVYYVVTNPSSIITRCLEWSPVSLVGRMSYSLYLWQQFFSDVVWEPYIPRMEPTWFRTIPANLICTFMCASISYRYIERPLITLRAKLRPQGTTCTKQEASWPATVPHFEEIPQR